MFKHNLKKGIGILVMMVMLFNLSGYIPVFAKNHSNNISGIVWRDFNSNGTRDFGEGVDGITVYSLHGKGNNDQQANHSQTESVYGVKGSYSVSPSNNGNDTVIGIEESYSCKIPSSDSNIVEKKGEYWITGVMHKKNDNSDINIELGSLPAVSIAPEVNISVSDVTGIRDSYEVTAENTNKFLQPNIKLKGDSFADINVKGNDVDFFKYQFIAGTEVPTEMPDSGWNDIDLTQETINEDVVLEQVGHLNQRAYDVSHMDLLSNVGKWSKPEEVFKTPFDATTYKAATYSQNRSEYGDYENYIKSDGTEGSRWVTNSMFMSNMNIGGNYKESSKFWGYIKVPTDGNYKFAALSDDGCKGYITVDGETRAFVDMFQPQSSTFGTENNEYSLKSDKFYPIYLEYFNWGGSANFELRYSDTGSITSDSSRIPAEWFYPSKNITPGEYATTTFTGSQGVKFPIESNDYYIAYKTGKDNSITREGFYGPFTVEGKTHLNLSKNVIGGNTVEINNDFILEYTIQAEDVVPTSTFKNLDGTLMGKIYLNTVKLQDEYPENIQIKSESNIVINDQKITAIIPDIEYNLTTKDGKDIYLAQPVKIQIHLSAEVIGDYTLSGEGKSIITLVDVNGANAQMEFNSIDVTAVDTADRSIIKTGIFLNKQFSERNNINLVKGFNINLAVEITNLNNHKFKLEMNNDGFITISNVEVYASTDLRNPIRNITVTGNTVTFENLQTSNSTYILVLKAKANRLTVAPISSKITIGNIIKSEKHLINVVKLPSLQ
ncbi:PA14 domain-containing protein [Clostridium sp.]|jgi:hypothetical protein|uniref:PA14 domain-containing protein n=1 Tax=Clostridium sp. TaxID=1506 RepID=UPI003EEB724C